jgi:hypothetical protein
MKSNTSVSVETNLLVEARGAGINLSKVLEEALKVKLQKEMTPDEINFNKEERLKELRADVYQKSQLYTEKFKEAVAYLKWLGEKSITLDERIIFWEKVLKLMREDIPKIKKEKVSKEKTI